MAVPVLGENGELLAALAIQAPEARMDVQTARRLPCRRFGKPPKRLENFSGQTVSLIQWRLDF